MSKRDDDSQADMEVGMTTAERRRRRRRGGGLRVPSDNVPRRTTTPPVVPPVPEDPSLAMSIAYSFSSDASEPVPRVTMDPPSGSHGAPTFGEPIAPEAMRTVIDPPSERVESVDFEMKTREMNAVDLEALGLASITTTDPMLGTTLERTFDRTLDQRVDTEKPVPLDVDIEVVGLEGPTLDSEPPGASSIPTVIPFEASSSPVSPMAPPGTKRERGERLRTVALSDEDLEEVREAVRAATAPAQPPAPTNPPPLSAPAPTPPPAAMTPLAPMFGQGPKPLVSNPTMPLTALDIEVETPLPPATPSVVDENPAANEMFAAKEPKRSDEPMSVPEIDLNDLAERSAEASGEIEVDVAEDEIKSGPHVAASAVPVELAPAESKRNRAPSQPPPIGDKSTRGGEAKAPDKLEAKAPPAPPAKPDGHAPPPPPPAKPDGHAQPPPPPPIAKAPPVPPPAPAKKDVKEKDKPPVTARTTTDTKPPPRGKPWFVDLFDEDYLRTLPFLTPQATQSEAEFVIDAMGLSPGAQVLDVGCGYGRHAMELAARGYHMVGLDLSTPLLVRGGEEAHRRGLSINFIRGDMRELDFDGQFDAAYCLFSTFGYFDDETNKKTVANIARALKPGGRVLIEILNRDYVIADLPTRVWWEGDGCVVLEEVELNYFSSRIQVNRSVVFDDGRQLEQEISVRAYSLHEVGKLMHAAGFRVLEVSGAYHTKGRFFGNQSRHIIVLAERKETAPSS